MSEIDEIAVEENDNDRSGGKLLGLLTATGLTAGAGWVAYSQMMIDHNLPLPLAIRSERHLFTSGMAGLLNYYVDDSAEGRPLVLIHSINAGATAYEMRPLFEYYRGERPVYALDLPGFGFSERSDRHYTPKLYAAAIRDFLTEIVEEPADVIALSLSSEFAARAALANPDLFHSLVLISPTGLSDDGGKKGSQKASTNGSSEVVYNLLSFPLWNQAIYDLLATKPSIRYFLKQSFHGPLDEGLEAYAYLTTHQPGARFAPLYFVSGRLFTPNVRQAFYEELELPALIIYDQDPYVSFEALPDLLLTHPNWNAVRITPTRGLPHFEQLETTARVLDNFWEGIKSS